MNKEILGEAGFIIDGDDISVDHKEGVCTPEIKALGSVLYARIAETLKGIDQNEVSETGGWWETFSGADFGAEKLEEIRKLLEGFDDV